MVEFLIIAKDGWMDNFPQAEIDTRKAASDNFVMKYEARHRSGDIVEVQEGAFYTEVHSFNRKVFVVLRITDVEIGEVRHYMKGWDRNVSVQRIKNDDVNYQYEYRVALNRLSTVVNDELFDIVKDRFDALPPDMTIVSRSSTEVVISLLPLTHPLVLAGKITPLQRKVTVEKMGKHILLEFTRLIRQSRYNISLGDLPQSVKDQLKSTGWVSFTKVQVASYLGDKTLG